MRAFSERVYNPILRRDPKKNAALDRFLGQVEKLQARAKGGADGDLARAKKLAYLAKLGIQKKESGPWDAEHMKAGDKFGGYVEHPKLGKIDIKLVVDSYDKVTWSSVKGEFDRTAKMAQDHPIALEGDLRKMDQAAYIFSKFNMRWRDFKGPMVTKEDVEHIDLKGLQFWFELVASVKDYPSEEEFTAACTDPSKGMSREDFIKFTAEDPTYLDVTMPTWRNTIRRIRMFDSDLELDGDFMEKARGTIAGFASWQGFEDFDNSGTFELKLLE